MLSSEFIVFDNPLEEGENVVGVSLLNYSLFIYGSKNWARFDMRGQKEGIYSNTVDPNEWTILSKWTHIITNKTSQITIPLAMEFDNKTTYRTIYWKGDLEDDKMLMLSHYDGVDYNPLEYHR